MNLLKNTALITFVSILCYALLVFGDYLIFSSIQYSLRKKSGYFEAKNIEKQRSISEDIPQRDLAIAEGFVPSIAPEFMDKFNFKYPLVAGIPFANTYYCNEGYGLVRYKSDRFGFRNLDALWDAQPRNIMIGDSFVHGACVPDEDTLPQQVAKKTGQAVLNLGMAGNNPSHYYAYSSLYIPVVKPSVVYLNFYPNDNGAFEVSAIERKYVKEKQEFFSKSDLSLFDLNLFIKAGEVALNRLRQEKTNYSNKIRKQYINILKRLSLPTIRSIILKNKSDFSMTEKTILHTNNLCIIHKCKVIVSFIPNSLFYRPDSRADNYGDEIGKLTEKLNIQFVDGRMFLDRTKESRDFARKGPHLSPNGYEKMATELAQH